MLPVIRCGKRLHKPNRFLTTAPAALFVSALILAAALLAPLPKAEASDPGSATLAPTAATPVTWSGTAVGGTTEANIPCTYGQNCDSFALTLSGAPADWSGKVARVKISWLAPATDYDMYIHKGGLDGPVVAESASQIGTTIEEVAEIDPGAAGTGTFVVKVVYFAATSADQYKGAASVEAKREPAPTPTPVVSTEPAPRYFNYAPPSGLGAGAGEPTIGINWATGKVMFIAGLQTLQVTFDDSSSPAKATWVNKPAINTATTSLDPILFTDGDAGAARTNRTFVSQLLGKASAMAFTDNDGETYTPSQGSGINSGVDHQTIGGGPYAKNADGSLKGGAVQRPGADGKIYPHAVYYASQDIGVAQAARSDDGGLTFGVAVPMYDITQCGGLHGHIKVAQDGTVYVPNKNCGGEQGVVVSEDNGLTWEVRTVPGSKSGRTDPSLGIGADGTVYFGYANGDGTPHAAVSRDKGRTWVLDQNVGAPLGIQNTVFSAVVAGDAERAAYFFLGTTTGGPAGTGTDQTAPYFDGTWYGFISTTYDGGRSWVTVNATPNDPVQRGVVCTNGTTCPDGTRNLLDFNDVTVDKQGRVLAAYADGCITAACVQGVDKDKDGRLTRFDNDGAERATIIRQSGGKPLFAAFDPPAAAAPAAPMLVASQEGNAVNLSWSTPDDGGSDITAYRVYRGAQGGAAALVATVAGDVNSYADTAAGANYYQVSAVNANGEGARSAAVTPAVLESPCKLPGITVLTDTSDAAPNAPLASSAANIKSLHVAEPYADGASKLVFTVRLGAGAFPANSQLYVIWNRTTPDANHDRNYLAMKSNLSGALSFEHGRVSYPLVYTSPAPNQGNLPTKFGSVEGSYDAATGTLRFIVTNEKIDNVAAGQALTGLEVRTFVGRNDSLPINQNLSSDFAGGGNYELAGNNSCLLPPAAPTALGALSPVKGVINLSWADNSADEDSFLIERSTSVDGGFEQIASVGEGVTAYTDSPVQRRVTYYYRVRAAKGATRSGYSNVASARTK
ncbi:MAG: hypothetical protein LC803_10040 [Acidobacteria bacterium]|nr:hypothetical protein [Acidobacteriota bacterium]